MDWSCFWLTIELIDSLIVQFEYIELNNIHLVGIVCCFITAKLMGKKGLTLRHVEVGLGHSKFSVLEILGEEEKILKMIF